ncbi:MAG: DUF3086 domain-containing protein [Synechococcaceae cyanobacterium]|nr:DUF3086 domain-containing protein [Synechococcaceae cyanobacterium]
MSDQPSLPESPPPSPAPEGDIAPAAGATDAPVPAETAAALTPLVSLALRELEARRQDLEAEIAALEQRRDQIGREIDSTFGGRSDAIARRLKGFQDYLVGALQDLAAAAEQMELVAQPVVVQPSPLDREATAAAPEAETAPAVAGQFAQDDDLIRDQLRRFQGQPDFYADPWKLRRTLDPGAAAALEDWFLNQGGRGAQPSAGSRNRNVLVAAAAIAILGELYGERFQTLVLAGEPERLGEWRRGLQDALGLSREDFGPGSGIVLFERPDALIERADRLQERGDLPFIVIDAAQPAVEVPILQFPLWLAFAAAPEELQAEEDLY